MEEDVLRILAGRGLDGEEKWRRGCARFAEELSGQAGAGSCLAARFLLRQIDGGPETFSQYFGAFEFIIDFAEIEVNHGRWRGLEGGPCAR